MMSGSGMASATSGMMSATGSGATATGAGGSAGGASATVPVSGTSAGNALSVPSVVWALLTTAFAGALGFALVF